MGNDLGQIGLVGGGFMHAHSTTLYKRPKYFEWSKGNILDTTFFIDEAIIEGLSVNCKMKVAWLVESRGIAPNATSFVKNNWKAVSESYDILLTHDKSIYELAENFYYIPPHGYWIENPQLCTKSKLVSLISSNKNILPGHSNRLRWVKRLRGSVDLYGMGFSTIEKKEEGLRDYMFSVVIENDQYETYWSEKILDCFACGTIPIYLGAPDIGDFFNADGIIPLNEDFDISTLNEELYMSKLPFIQDNLERTLNYNVIEDIIYNRWLKLQ